MNTSFEIIEPVLVTPYATFKDMVYKHYDKEDKNDSNNKSYKAKASEIDEHIPATQQTIPYLPSAIDLHFYIGQSSFIGISEILFFESKLENIDNGMLKLKPLDKNNNKHNEKYNGLLREIDTYIRNYIPEKQVPLLLSFKNTLLKEYISGKRTFHFVYLIPICLKKTSKIHKKDICYLYIKTKPIDILNIYYSELKYDKLNRLITYNSGYLEHYLSPITDQMLSDYLVKSFLSHPLSIYYYSSYENISYSNNEYNIKDDFQNPYSYLNIIYISEYIVNNKTYSIPKPSYQLYSHISKLC